MAWKKATNARKLSTAATSVTLFPSVQRLVHEYSLQVNNLLKLGTGPKGRLTKGDVLKYVEVNQLKKSPAALPEYKRVGGEEVKGEGVKVSVSGSAARVVRNRTGPAAYTEEATDNMRRVIAQRLTESKTKVPHAYATREIPLTALSALRKKLNSSLDETTKLSVTDFLIRASAIALRLVPEANAQFNPKTQAITPMDNIDISLAVALDSGLITPIIFNADKKGLSTLSSEAKDLAKRARNKGLKPHEYQGGTFSISNLGMFGITEFSAVINPPQAMILAVGGPISSVEVDASSSLKPASSLRVTLSYDARAVEADIATKWLDSFQELLSNPSRLML